MSYLIKEYNKVQFIRLQTDFDAKIKNLLDRVIILEHNMNVIKNTATRLNIKICEKQLKL